MPSRGRRLGPCEVATSEKPHYLWSLLRPETAFFFETRPNIDAFSSSQPVLPYPPQEMLDFQLFNQVVAKSMTGMLHSFGQVPILIGGTSGEAATFMKYCLSIWTNPNSQRSLPRDYYLQPELMLGLNDELEWETLMNTWRVFQGPVSSTCPNEYSKAARQFYFGETIELDEVDRLVEMLTDIWLW